METPGWTEKDWEISEEGISVSLCNSFLVTAGSVYLKLPCTPSIVGILHLGEHGAKAWRWDYCRVTGIGRKSACGRNLRLSEWRPSCWFKHEL